MKKPLIFVGVTEEYLAELESAFGSEFFFTHERECDDYIYTAEKLCILTGKALHSKRNHINSFKNNYSDWSLKPLEKAHISLCLDIMERWKQTHSERDNIVEDEAIRFAFQNFDALNMQGDILFSIGMHVAFTFGERLCKDTFVIHFEKALTDIDGAYAMINREFVCYITESFSDIRYINREEDMGIQNLRKAKESYVPCFTVKKYTLVWRCQK